MDSLDKKIISIILAGLGVVMIGSGGEQGIFGIKKEKEVYSFNYRGKKAVVKAQDYRLSTKEHDNYFILIDGKDRVDNGELIMDDNNIISVNSQGYKIRNSNKD